ncbi:DUF2274 domain-containing protein [Mesorhizobium sp. M0482]|uniref:DUF2274 domain-containing protein n=1 Tax=unclassified Mesorhizobium TaxID=325217 RepID=UPI00333BC4AC
MADSDNTTTLSFVTRRRVLAAGMITSTALVVEKNAFAESPAAPSMPPDPALALRREWQTAHKLTNRLCRRQQRLETRLVECVGFPCVDVRLPEGEELTVYSIEALDQVLGNGPDTAALREKAETELAAHQARWDAAAEKTGYIAALRAEREAGERATDLLEAFSTTPATTLAGVAGKLDALLREGEAGEECSEFPWPQIRSALSDLVRISEGFGADRVRRRRIRRDQAETLRHPDNRPVKITVELPGAVHRDLVAYAELLGRETGQIVADPAKLIVPMLTRFMTTDRAFARARRTLKAG